MDRIERVFGLDPDGGNGSLELLIAVALIVAILVLALRVYGNRRRYTKERRGTRERSETMEGGLQPAATILPINAAG